MKWRAFTTLCK